MGQEERGEPNIIHHHPLDCVQKAFNSPEYVKEKEETGQLNNLTLIAQRSDFPQNKSQKELTNSKDNPPVLNATTLQRLTIYAKAFLQGHKSVAIVTSCNSRHPL